MNRSDLSIVITRYILGQLPEEERARLEEEYFANSDLFEEMVAAENDLIDAYVAGKLHGNDLLQFENHFLSTPEHREQVAFAKSLLNSKGELSSSLPLQTAATSQRPLPPFFLPRVAVASIFLLLLTIGIWLTIWNIRLKRELGPMRQSQAKLEQEQRELQQKNGELEAELRRRPALPAQPTLPLGTSGQAALLMTLTADLTRGHARPNILPLSSRIASVVLVLETEPGRYSGYEISLETPSGTTVSRKKGLPHWITSKGTRVAVQLSPSALQKGDYVIRLMAIGPNKQVQEVDDYSFRVVTR